MNPDDTEDTTENDPLQPPTLQPSQTPTLSGQVFELPLTPPKKKSKKKLIILLAALAVLLAAAAWFAIANLTADKPAADSQLQADEGKVVNKGLVASVNSQEDLANLSQDDQINFCEELMTLDPEGAEVKALHDRLGLNGDLYNNIWLGCVASIEGRNYIKKDISGANDAYYRRDAKKNIEEAKAFTFDLYDTTAKIDDLGLSKRAALTDNDGREARSLLMAYSTLVDGGYDPFRSQEEVTVQLFNPSDLPNYSSRCGPSHPAILTTYLTDDGACDPTAHKFAGQTIYKGEEFSGTTYTVTVGKTRIVVEARDEAEAVRVLQGMKKVSLDQMDFFIKN